MALELLNHYRRDLSELKLIPTGGGTFEVSVDGKLVFSKLSEGRFPDLKELKQLIG
jgi:selenoprotein W-related protein